VLFVTAEQTAVNGCDTGGAVKHEDRSSAAFSDRVMIPLLVLVAILIVVVIIIIIIVIIVVAIKSRR